MDTQSSIETFEDFVCQEELCTDIAKSRLLEINDHLAQCEEIFNQSKFCIEETFENVKDIIESWKRIFLKELEESVKGQQRKFLEDRDHLKENVDKFRKFMFSAKVHLKECSENQREETALKYLDYLSPIVEVLIQENSLHLIKFVANENSLKTFLKSDDMHKIGYIQYLPVDISSLKLEPPALLPSLGSTVVFIIRVPDNYNTASISKFISWKVFADGQVIKTKISNENCNFRLEFLVHKNVNYEVNFYIFNQHIDGSPSNIKPRLSTGLFDSLESKVEPMNHFFVDSYKMESVASVNEQIDRINCIASSVKDVARINADNSKITFFDKMHDASSNGNVKSEPLSPPMVPSMMACVESDIHPSTTVPSMMHCVKSELHPFTTVPSMMAFVKSESHPSTTAPSMMACVESEIHPSTTVPSMMNCVKSETYPATTFPSKLGCVKNESIASFQELSPNVTTELVNGCLPIKKNMVVGQHANALTIVPSNALNLMHSELYINNPIHQNGNSKVSEKLVNRTVRVSKPAARAALRKPFSRQVKKENKVNEDGTLIHQSHEDEPVDLEFKPSLSSADDDAITDKLKNFNLTSTASSFDQSLGPGQKTLLLEEFVVKRESPVTSKMMISSECDDLFKKKNINIDFEGYIDVALKLQRNNSLGHEISPVKKVARDSKGLNAADDFKSFHHFIQVNLTAKCQAYFKGNSEVQMTYPIGIAELKNGNIVVADTFSDRMLLFSNDAKFVKEFNGPKRLSQPSAIDVLPDGVFAVRDNNAITTFSPDCQPSKTIGASFLKKPYGITHDNKGNLVTIDTCVEGFSIVRIDPASGKLVNRVLAKTEGSPSDIKKSKPRFISFRAPNTLLVVDLGLDLVYILEMDTGNLINKFGGSGTANGKFKDPSGIVCDADGYMFIGDSRNHRIQMFAPDGKFLSILKVDRPLKRPSGLFLTPNGQLYVLNYWENSFVKYEFTVGQSPRK